MELEQKPPNGPNFKLVVMLFAAAIVVVLVVGIFVSRHAAKDLPAGSRPDSTRTAAP